MYFGAHLSKPTGNRRIDDSIGTFLPAFVSISAIAGDAAAAAIIKAAGQSTWDATDQLNLGSANFAMLYFGADNYVDKMDG